MIHRKINTIIFLNHVDSLGYCLSHTRLLLYFNFLPGDHLYVWVRFKCMYDLSVDGSLGRCFNQGVVVRLVFSGDTAHSDSFIGPELPETEGEQST